VKNYSINKHGAQLVEGAQQWERKFSYLFIQYLLPVGGGPSSKTWPRWASQTAQRTSVRGIKMTDISSLDFTLFPIGS